MNSRINHPWIPGDKIEAFIQIEPALILVALALGSWLVYRLFLRGVSDERHRNFKRLFINLTLHLTLGCLSFLAYAGLRHYSDLDPGIDRLSAYIGLITLAFGATVFVKTCRIFVFEYLFLSHMRVGVPLLLVNLFTLLLSICVSGWMITEIFDIRIAPVLATSAIFSIVLGLAMQDTLGNLFAGVALQFDKPYEIGDWIEVHGSGQKWVGQVHEISWRATVLIGFGDELITIPNRIMGQSQISNFATKQRPIIRSQIFRIPYESDETAVRQALLRAANSVPGLCKLPAPFTMITESAESCVLYKIVYYLQDYGAQNLIADQVIAGVLKELAVSQITIATPRLTLARL